MRSCWSYCFLCWDSNTTAENRESSKIPDKNSCFDVVVHPNLQGNNRDEQNRQKEQPTNKANGNQKSLGHLKGAKTVAR